MPQDFNTMQAQAVAYAKEMYNKSSNNTISTDEYKNKTKESANTSEFFKSSSPIKNIHNSSNHAESKDNDIAIIMALLLLLAQDGADKMLMLALLYIMT